MQVGSIVMHNGEEKEVIEKVGEVLILNDSMVVRIEDVSLVNERTTPVEEVPVADKHAVRARIESINCATSVDDLIATIKEIDPSMSIRAIDYNGIDNIKTHLIRKALRLGLIDPKVCESCGQMLPE